MHREPAQSTSGEKWQQSLGLAWTQDQRPITDAGAEKAYPVGLEMEHF